MRLVTLKKLQTMKYFKSLLTLLFVGLAFSACNEYEDFDKEANTVNYSAEGPALGSYESVYVPNSEYSYGLIFTTDSEGDSVIHVTMTGLEGTEEANIVRTVAIASDVEYDSELGVLTATAPEDESYYETEVSITLAYQRDAKTLVMSMSQGSEKVSCHMVPSTATPSFIGSWGTDMKTNDGTYSIAFGIYQMNGDTVAAMITQKTMQQETADLTFNESSVTLKGQFTGTTLVMAYSKENGQFTVTDEDGNVGVCGRERSQPEPEVYEEYAYGKYVHGASGSLFVNAFGQEIPNLLGKYAPSQKYDAVLYRSSKKSNRYVIEPYMNGQQLAFQVDNATGYVVVGGSSSGMQGNAGTIVVVDSYSVLGEYPSEFDEEAGVINFYLLLGDNQYYYGVDHDQFIITGSPTNAPKKQQKTMPVLSLEK